MQPGLTHPGAAPDLAPEAAPPRRPRTRKPAHRPAPEPAPAEPTTPPAESVAPAESPVSAVPKPRRARKSAEPPPARAEPTGGDEVGELVVVPADAWVAPARERPRPGQTRPPVARAGDDTDPARQLSLFGVEARPPVPADLEGLLAGPGQVVRMGGTARVSVVVVDLWRAKVLTRELRTRGLAATCVATAEQHIGVRSAYSTALAPLAHAWLRGAVKAPPPGFALDGRRLRLWLAAVGERDEQGVALRLGAGDEATWGPAGAALATLGLAPELLGPRAGGPAYRISGQRRLARLRELVGEPPADAPAGFWPE